MPPDTWQHWRVLLADRDARTKTVSVGPGCEVALDGARRRVAHRGAQGSATNSIDLTGASRADLAVRCSRRLRHHGRQQLVANIFVDGTADPGPNPYDTTASPGLQRPTYLRDLPGADAVNTETSHGRADHQRQQVRQDVPTFT